MDRLALVGKRPASLLSVRKLGLPRRTALPDNLGKPRLGSDDEYYCSVICAELLQSPLPIRRFVHASLDRTERPLDIFPLDGSL